MWGKVVPGNRVTILAESTLASVYMRKEIDPFSRAKSLPCKCLYGGKVDSAKRVTLLVEPTFCFSCKWLVKFSNEM